LFDNLYMARKIEIDNKFIFDTNNSFWLFLKAHLHVEMERKWNELNSLAAAVQ